MRCLLSSLFLLLLLPTTIYAQNISDLKKQRLKTVAEIENTSRLLDEKSKNKNVLLTNVSLLTTQITARQRVISNVELEISELDSELATNQKKLAIIINEVNITKANYELLVVHAYTHRFKYDMLMFILSSQNLSVAYNRYLLLKDFTSQIKREGEHLSLLMAQQESQTVLVKNNLLHKQDVHQTLEYSSRSLAKEKSTKEVIIKDLEKEEKWLRAELKKKEKMANALDDQIRKAIEAEAKKVSKTSSKAYLPSEFGKAKGNLNWPVKNGVVISYFGEHDHPIIKSLKVKNNGIDIEVNKGSSVLSVFKGQVSKVIAIPGYNMAVLVRHGNYLTVYANLVSVKVANGDAVSEGQIIGTLFTEVDEFRSFLHFEIWKESEKMDPIFWLRRDNL